MYLLALIGAFALFGARGVYVVLFVTLVGDDDSCAHVGDEDF